MKRNVYRQSNDANSLYYMATYGKWYIGSSTGSTSRGVEIDSLDICADKMDDADWFEWGGSQMNESNNIRFQCVDDITCSCKMLDIAGLANQSTRNGLYIFNNSTLNGRNRFLTYSCRTSIRDKNPSAIN